MTIDELIVEALAARDRFWFVQTLQVRERTDATVTVRFIIGLNSLSRFSSVSAVSDSALP